MKKKNAHNKQKSNNVGRPRRTANFCASFSSINKAFVTVQKYPAATMSVSYYPRRTDVPFLSTNQQTACVAREIASTPTEEYSERVRRSVAQSGSRPLSPGHTPSGNATRTAPLWTEPTRTLRWKRSIISANNFSLTYL